MHNSIQTIQQKNSRIPNAIGLFFPKSRHYKEFKTVWSKSVNSQQSKSHLVEAENFRGEKIKTRQAGWLKASHHLLYLALSGKNYVKAFQPLTNSDKLKQDFAFRGFLNARLQLSWYASLLEDSAPEWSRRYLDRIDEFLKPFEYTVSKDMLIAVNKLITPDIRIHSHWSLDYRAVKNQILEIYGIED